MTLFWDLKKAWSTIAGRSDTAVFVVFLFVPLLLVLSVQLLLIPLFMGVTPNPGLLADGDWNNFHELAVSLADKVAVDGWSVWSLTPRNQIPVGILSALYVLFEIKHPILYSLVSIPLFTTSMYLMYCSIKLITDRLIAFGSVLVVLFFPSSFIVYGTPLKDVFTYFAIITVLTTIFNMFHSDRIYYLLSGFKISLAIGIAYIARPYFPPIMIAMLFSALIFEVLRVIASSIVFSSAKWRGVRPRIVPIALMVMIAVCSYISFKHSYPSEKGNQIENAITNTSKIKTPESTSKIKTPERNFSWFYDSAPLRYANKIAKAVGEQRRVYVEDERQDISTFDRDVAISEFKDLVFYAPRAIVVGFLSPLPNHWYIFVKRGLSLSTIISIAETLFLYSLIGFLFFAVCKGYVKFSVGYLALLMMLCSYFIIWVSACPNLGLLYRLRLPARDFLIVSMSGCVFYWVMNSARYFHGRLR